jgi:hypothetical protein
VWYSLETLREVLRLLMLIRVDTGGERWVFETGRRLIYSSWLIIS